MANEVEIVNERCTYLDDKGVAVRIIRSDSKEFIFDGTDWRIMSLEGFGDFENDITMIDNAIGDGGIYGSARIAQKDRTISAKSRNPVMNEILRKLALSYFNPKLKYKIYVTYMGRTRWFEGIVHRFNLPSENIYKTMILTVTFLSANPYLKSFDDFGKNIASIAPMCAFPFLCSITPGTPRGTTGGIYNFAQKIVLENDGDVDTFCKAVFTAKGTVTNPKLVVNDHYVRVLDIMSEGDVIIIDFTKNPPTVQKNGVNFIGHCDRTSAFDDMALTVGDSVISYDADNGSNLMDVSIYYNKLYSAV